VEAPGLAPDRHARAALGPAPRGGRARYCRALASSGSARTLSRDAPAAACPGGGCASCAAAASMAGPASSAAMKPRISTCARAAAAVSPAPGPWPRSRPGGRAVSSSSKAPAAQKSSRRGGRARLRLVQAHEQAVLEQVGDGGRLVPDQALAEPADELLVAAHGRRQEGLRAPAPRISPQS